MSPMIEQNLELLETYLDGELPAGERDALARRLEADAALSASLEALRAERFIRGQAFESLEPDERKAQQFAWQLTQSLKLGRVPSSAVARSGLRWQSMLRTASTVAAAIIVGFGVGWATRGPWGGSGIGPSSAFPANQVSAEYRVPLTNSRGETIALQDFESPERAREFVQKTKLGIVVKPGILTLRGPDGKVKADQPGMLVSEVFPNTVAAKAGLLPGDIILAFGGMNIRDADTFVAAVSRQTGLTKMTILRKTETIELTVDLRSE